MLEKTNQVNLLFDFYASLLKGKQREYLELYYLDDLSLGEIAEMHEVSRQAVYDHIKRAEKQLFEYDQKLRLAERHEKRMDVLNRMNELVSGLSESETRDELNTLLHQLSEMD
ncbi:putative DNA-binding protein [Brevibacillus sp. DP1.3A]|uniref:putative DNA-binding protein n=1 Tax=Brevibacillus sp. DP1.3A TaxID=2738867 RepID=UPI00156B9EF5|nr:putative DNA-binding protein [Brevibacillus sp. DP1.3A]MED1917728.1 putative DNA-binding protein [Bacillus thuringiensis]UED77300.1 putative DNA-binding protein [Brevibacillus sp. DP1.3A]